MSTCTYCECTWSRPGGAALRRVWLSCSTHSRPGYTPRAGLLARMDRLSGLVKADSMEGWLYPDNIIIISDMYIKVITYGHGGDLSEDIEHHVAVNIYDVVTQRLLVISEEVDRVHRLDPGEVAMELLVQR